MTMQRMKKLYKLPEVYSEFSLNFSHVMLRLLQEPKTRGFRPTEAKDVPAVHQLLNSVRSFPNTWRHVFEKEVVLFVQYLARFELAPEFTLDEVEHYFIPKDKIIYTYVVDQGNGNITDFTSFYSLPSTVVNHATHDSIYAAYSFYNVATKTSWEDLMTDAIIMAKKVLECRIK